MVVYKVDRLSRSLLDFTRLLSLFEKRGVSFVSVTQDFNTSSSMGRLTLHILLSFAQFEREIIGERTRDKLSAARRKGKWIGGRPVLGYDVAPEGGRLVVNAAEAERVREIFALCAGSSSMTEALQAARARGWTAKHWTSRRGRVHGGQLLSMSTLRLLVTNVLYRGDITHKDVVYPGEHPALVPHELWLAVHAKHQLSRAKVRCHGTVETRLKGLVSCAHCGGLLAASFTQRHGQRHVYYLCRAGKKRVPVCPQQPVLSLDLEKCSLVVCLPSPLPPTSVQVIATVVDRRENDSVAVSHQTFELFVGTRCVLNRTLQTGRLPRTEVLRSGGTSLIGLAVHATGPASTV